MSLIGGVLYLHESDPAADRLGALVRSLVDKGHTRPATAWSPPVGMVHYPLDSDVTESQTGLYVNEGLMVSWDGRLDNGDDLIASLGLDRCEQLSDIEIVRQAFTRWRHDCFDRIIGDWAIVTWEPRCRRLLLARDPFGTRPLFYHRGVSQIVWSSRLEAILDATGISDELDESWIAGYLAGWLPPGATPYRRLREVPPGSVVSADQIGVHLTTFWRPRTEPKVRCSCDREYEEQFEHLFRQSVCRRLRSRGPVGADLSGGLDSSSIVCIGEDLIRRGEAEAPEILPVSYLYNDCSSANEKRYISSVERLLGRPSEKICHGDFTFFGRQPSFDYPSFLQCFWEREVATNSYLVASGAQVYLRGIGGDELMWSEAMPELELADLVVSRHPLRLLRAARRHSLIHQRSMPALLLRDLAGPVLSRSFGVVLRQREKTPDWIDRRFARRTNLRRLHNPELGVDRSVKLPTDRFQVMQVQDCIRFVAWQYDRGESRLHTAYPFLDRDLVEHCLALPISQLVRGTETRSVQRRALAHLLPQEVCMRRSKAALDEALIIDLRRTWSATAAILERPLVAELGIVNAGALREAAQRARFGLPDNFYRLCHVLSLEHWLRQREKRRTAPVGETTGKLNSAPVPASLAVGERVPA